MTHPPSEAIARTPPHKRDPRGTRDRLVRAALELFTTQGYHASTTPEIAAKAGVAEGTIYRHFASKEQLLNEIYRAGVRVFVTTVREQPAALPCAERLQRIAAGWRDVALRNPALVRLVFVGRIRTLLDARSRDAAKELRGEIEQLIASGKAAGHVRPGAAEVWADIWMQVIGLMVERVANKEWAPDQAGPRLAVESAWAAIAAPGAPAPPTALSAPSPTSPPAAPPPGPPPAA
jgi:AcrR family transcriptional regulator